MITKTMKYEIKYNKELYSLLNDIQYVVYRLKNKATSMAWDWQQFSFGYNERFGEYPKEKNIMGKTLSPDIYNVIKDEFGDFVSSSIVDTAIQDAVKKFKNDSKEINRGERSIANYKRDGAFPLRKTQVKKLEKVNSKTFTAKFSLLSNEGKKQRELKTGQIDVTLKTGGGATVILERVMNGEYEMCDSQIGKTKNKFYFIMTYQLEKDDIVILDENKIMGIDVGYNIPAVIATNFDDWYKQFVGSGKEIRDFETKTLARKRRIQQSRKWCGKGSRGHGTKTRIKAVAKINDSVSNFKQTKNHNWSKYIVDEALKMGCGTIQMEDLSGINEKNTFLKTWSYYQLQQYIEYKAKSYGIKVVKIKPNHTSARCNKCGYIHSGKDADKWRPASENKSMFYCQNCNHKSNADHNAAKNIAMKDIEEIIKHQLYIQENVKEKLKV